MIRIILNIIGLSVLFGLMSCNEWLKVDPEGQLPKEDMFSSEDGFTGALTGVYMDMKSSSTYGYNLSVYATECLVSSWDVSEQSVGENIGRFNYGVSDVQNIFESIFQQQYFTISEINSILSVIDEKKDVFITEGLYEQVKGECLGLRAYLHFDLWRMFGPVPGTETGLDVLPYMTTVSKGDHPYDIYPVYKAILESDIADAMDLLQEAEQYGIFEGYESIRMNSVALKALKARAALWFGETDEAIANASAVIDSTSSILPDLRLGNADDLSNRDYIMTAEHIFGIHKYDMYDFYQNNFANQLLTKGTGPAYANELYGTAGLGVDIRLLHLWGDPNNAEGSTPAYSIKKYQVEESADAEPAWSDDYRRIPLIRMSEMYLIAIEAATDQAKAQTLWDNFRASRMLPLETLPSDKEELRDKIIEEYRREFFAEGQGFYAYKRLNVGKDKFLWLPSEVSTINYVVPVPQDEIYGNN
ncbi:MAG: RagB/SusD family nutrient uptake outer membrane protein [Bacteroidales bacterium]